MPEGDRVSAVRAKKSYEKPVLRSISLAVDQVLGNTCKGPIYNPSTNLGGQPSGCATGLCKFELGS